MRVDKGKRKGETQGRKGQGRRKEKRRMWKRKKVTEEKQKDSEALPKGE